MIRTLDGMLGGVMGGLLSIELGRNADAFLLERVAYMCFARVERRHPEPRQRGRAVGPPFARAFGVNGPVWHRRPRLCFLKPTQPGAAVPHGHHKPNCTTTQSGQSSKEVSILCYTRGISMPLLE